MLHYFKIVLYYYMQNIEDHAGRFCGFTTKTQKRIHCAKVYRVTPRYVKIEDRNDGKTYKYNRNSILDCRF